MKRYIKTDVTNSITIGISVIFDYHITLYHELPERSKYLVEKKFKQFCEDAHFSDDNTREPVEFIAFSVSGSMDVKSELIEDKNGLPNKTKTKIYAMYKARYNVECASFDEGIEILDRCFRYEENSNISRIKSYKFYSNSNIEYIEE